MNLDIETLKWVLQQADELQNKIWDLREAIFQEIENQKELQHGKEEVALFSSRSY